MTSQYHDTATGEGAQFRPEFGVEELIVGSSRVRIHGPATFWAGEVRVASADMDKLSEALMRASGQTSFRYSGYFSNAGDARTFRFSRLPSESEAVLPEVCELQRVLDESGVSVDMRHERPNFQPWFRAVCGLRGSVSSTVGAYSLEDARELLPLHYEVEQIEMYSVDPDSICWGPALQVRGPCDVDHLLQLVALGTALGQRDFSLEYLNAPCANRVEIVGFSSDSAPASAGKNNER